LIDEQTLPALIAEMIQHSIGRSDAIALVCAYRGARDADLDLVERADTRLTAVKLTAESRRASHRTGRQMLAMGADLLQSEFIESYQQRVKDRALPGNHAVAMGLIKSEMQIDVVHAVAGELYSFAASCAGAALRMSLIDHWQAQRVVNEVKPIIAAVSPTLENCDVRDIAGSVPLSETMSMKHEEAEVRLFVS